MVKETRGLSPLEVRKRSEAFARKFIDIQRAQFKRLGVFGDWEHPYLTMDPAYEAEILRAFAVFVEHGLVYESMKPVFWSTGAQTALAEAEVEYQEREDTAVYVKFPIVTGALAGKASIVIWTTTPWTLPANLAIAVHPKELYVAQKFTNGRNTETLVLAEKLLPHSAPRPAFLAGVADPGRTLAETNRGQRPEHSLSRQQARRDRRAASVSAPHRHRPDRRFRHDGYRHRRRPHRARSRRR